MLHCLQRRIRHFNTRVWKGVLLWPVRSAFARIVTNRPFFKPRSDANAQNADMKWPFPQTTGRVKKGCNAKIAGSLRYLMENAVTVAQSINERGHKNDKRWTPKMPRYYPYRKRISSRSRRGYGAPSSDNAVITPIQLAMAISLGKVFGVSLTETTAMAAIGSVAANTLGRTAS